MSKKTPQSTEAGKANVSRTTTNRTIQGTPVFHIGLNVHAADFTAAIAEPGRENNRSARRSPVLRCKGTMSADMVKEAGQ